MGTAAIFPGQGAQSVGMLADLAKAHPSVLERFEEASEVLGFDLWQLAQAGPEEVLAATENTQPLLLTASVAAFDVWRTRADLPSIAGGHSLGEYSALTSLGAIPFDQAVGLVRLRGTLMEQAVPSGQGGMAAVMGLEDAQVEAVCEAVSGEVVAANYNAPGQVVIAGSAEAVDAACVEAKAAGAKLAKKLNVSGPFHSPLMAPAREAFGEALADISLSMPEVPVVHNVSADVAADLESLKSLLLAQIAAPVRWAQSIEVMREKGADRFVECGPGKVLSGLNKRISREIQTFGTESPDALEGAWA